jgi:hypothetical protein
MRLRKGEGRSGIWLPPVAVATILKAGLIIPKTI